VTVDASPPAPLRTSMELVGFHYIDTNGQYCTQERGSDPYYAPETPDHVPAHEDTMHQRIWQGTSAEPFAFGFTVCGPNGSGNQGASSISIRVAFDPQFRAASGYITGPGGEVRDFVTVDDPGAIGGDTPMTIGACFMPVLWINGNDSNTMIDAGSYSVVVTDLGPGPNTKKGAKGNKELAIFAFEDMGYAYSQDYCPERDKRFGPGGIRPVPTGLP
jgi:hypothetical protein